MTTDTGYLSKTMAIIIHTVLPPKLFFISNAELQSYNSSNTSFPVLTSLEEEAVPGYIQFAGHLAQGGRNSSWNQVKSTDGEFINAEMKLE